MELGVSLGIMGSLALVDAQENKFEVSQVNAKALGNEIFQYNSAVSRYLAEHAGDPAAVGITPVSPQTHVGSNWLKDASCSGTASQAYLACEMMGNGTTIHYQSLPTTTITQNADGALTARTVWSPAFGEGGKEDSTVMGIAAMVASGSYMTQANDAASGYQLPTVFCPDISSHSVSIASICQSDRNQIISTANTNSVLEPWLRTDHGNTMVQSIEFGNTVSTQAEIDSVDDGGAVGSWAGSGMRQIINVARLYNGRAGDQDSVVIGRLHGKSLFSDGFVTSNNLLENAVILDGDAAVMEDLHVRLNAYVNNNIVVGNDVIATRDIRSTGGDIVAESGDILADSGQIRGGYVRSTSDVMANGSLRAGNSVYAQRYYDTNDTNKYLDPDSRSQVNSITATGDVRATIFYDQNNTGYYANPSATSRLNAIDANSISSRGEVRGTLFRDGTSGYYANPASTSRLNAIDANSVRSRGRLRTDEYLHLNRSVSVGGWCSPSGLVGRTSDGTLASCVSNRWKKSGGGGTLQCYQRYVSYDTPYNISSYSRCASGYTMVGFETSGKNGRSISGGTGGDVRSWQSCCRIVP